MIGCLLAALLATVAAFLFGQLCGIVASAILVKANVTHPVTREAVPLLAWALGFTSFLWGSLRLWRRLARRAASGLTPFLLADDGLGVLEPAGLVEIPYARVDAIWVIGAPGGQLQAFVVRDASGRPHAASGGGASYDAAIADLRDRAARVIVPRLRAMLEAGHEVLFRGGGARKGGGLVLTGTGVRPIGTPRDDEVAWRAIREVQEDERAARVLATGTTREIVLEREAENWVFFRPLVESLRNGA